MRIPLLIIIFLYCGEGGGEKTIKLLVTEGFHFRPPPRARFPMRVRKCDRVKAKVINPLIGSNAGEKVFTRSSL